ncbi:hypothetical protein MSAN_01944600 [Mycena sanguinolenta]|uniref:Uncharacterized protein n=1 Tax=Mycena sanguinolenta TaxID=230812 RepID=A0A8H7CRA9_9AGAR|nr:hypothetical protein MSAN_01944600 [Mycena sanguinolenta]
MLVCKTITNEMQHYVQGRSTYTFLTMASGFDSLAQCVGWQQIPCSPSTVRTLQANLIASFWTKWWWQGDDEPTPLISDLSHPLGFDFANPSGWVASQRESEVERKKELWPDVQRCISWVVDRGLLFGAVYKIVCEWADDGDRVKWEVLPLTIDATTESGFLSSESQASEEPGA